MPSSLAAAETDAGGDSDSLESNGFRIISWVALDRHSRQLGVTNVTVTAQMLLKRG